MGAPMVASDGSVFLEVATYDYLTDWEPCGTYTRTFQSTLSLLKVAPDGASSMTPLKATSTVTSSLGSQPIEEVFPGETIPDGQGGVLASWADVVFAIGPFFGTPTTQRTTKVTRVLNGGLNEYDLPLTVNQSDTFPVIDRFPVGPPSGSLVLGENGEAFASDGQKVIAFDSNSGTVNWTYQAAGGKTSLVAALAGGGVAIQNSQLGVVTLDATGTTAATAPYLHNATPWTLGFWAAQGSLDMIAGPSFDLALSLWPIVDGNRQRQRATPRPILAHFIPVNPGDPSTPQGRQFTATYAMNEVLLKSLSQTQAEQRFYLNSAATVGSFLREVATPISAVAFIGHSFLIAAQPINGMPQPAFSVGLFLADKALIRTPVNSDPLLNYNVSDPSTVVEIESVPSQAKIIFVAACALGKAFTDFWKIDSVTKGRALVFSPNPETDLVQGVLAWAVVEKELTMGKTIKQAVDAANQDLVSRGRSEQWSILGDTNAQIAPEH